MATRYIFWLRTVAVLQLLTAFVHTLGILRQPPPSNETERQLQELLTTYKLDLGPYFHPTMSHLITGLSSCFSLLYLLGGLMIFYLIQQKASAEMLKGTTSIYLLVFGGCFLIMLIFTFLPPIILTGLVFLSLCFAYATNHIHFIHLPKN